MVYERDTLPLRYDILLQTVLRMNRTARVRKEKSITSTEACKIVYHVLCGPPNNSPKVIGQ